MAISTYQIYLGVLQSGSNYKKLVDIKNFPDLGAEPELIETTTLSDEMQTNILGIQGADSLEFTANYDKTKFTEIKALEKNGSQQFAIFLGKTGENGIFGWTGGLRVRITGGEVNSVVEMAITCIASTPIRPIETATIELGEE